MTGYYGQRRDEIHAAAASDTDDCIVWQGATSRGYARTEFNGRMRSVAHLVLELTSRPRPTPGHQACHLAVVCHQPLCINPRHLRWDTRVGNWADRIADGTHVRGVRNGQARLTESDVHAIRADGRSQRIIAADYCVHLRTIADIKTRRNWAWLPEKESCDQTQLFAYGQQETGL